MKNKNIGIINYVHKEKGNSMISSDFIGRIYEYDKATGLTIALMSKCIDHSSENISPDDIISMYEKFSPLGRKMADQIEAGEISRNKRIEKDSICVPKNILNSSSSSSPSMRSTPR